MGKINIKTDRELEENILGCLLSDANGLKDESVAKLKPSDFQYESHQIVFNTITELYNSDQPVNTITLTSRLKELDKLEKVGGAYWVDGLISENMILISYLPAYAEKLIGYTKHNNQIRLTEDVRLGKIDISELLKAAESERQKEYPQSDSGNAEMLHELFQDKIRYDHDSGGWKVWNGVYWQPDRKRQIYHFATEVARKRQEQARTLSDSRDKKELFNFGVQSENIHKITSMFKRASALDGIATISEDWDRDPLLFQCSNGVLILNTHRFMDGNPEWMISQNSGVKYDPKAECPVFDKFILDIMDGHEEMADYLLMCMGYSLSGLTDEQCMFLLVGDGANGKSVLIDLMSTLYGDYHQHSRFDAFLKKYNDSSSHDLAKLHNARIVTANESGIAKRWDEERIKEITGGDKITARHLYQSLFTFKSKIKLWCATNNLPKVDDFTPAFWRRIKVIPFNRKFEGKDRDTGIVYKLKEELPGILNRILMGFGNWMKNGLNDAPQQIKQATENYRNESDMVAQFIADCITDVGGGSDVSITAKQMHEEYKIWNEENTDGKPFSIQVFGKRMNQLGYKSEKHGGVKKYFGLGVGLKDSEGVFL